MLIHYTLYLPTFVENNQQQFFIFNQTTPKSGYELTKDLDKAHKFKNMKEGWQWLNEYPEVLNMEGLQLLPFPFCTEVDPEAFDQLLRTAT